MPLRNPALFIVLSLAWGGAFTAIKAGLEYFPPVLFAAIRYDLAGLLMLGFAIYLTDHWLPSSRREWLLIGIAGALMIGTYHAFLFIGQQGTTSAAAAIVVSLSPILTTAFARGLLPDERLTTLGLVGLTIGFLGVVVMSEPDPTSLTDSRTVSIGLIFIATAAFALGSVLTRSIDVELPIETLQAWSMLFGAALMHLASIAIGESASSIEWTLEAVISLGYLVIVASALGFLIYFDLLERLGPIEINLVSYAVPVTAAITGLIFLAEIPTVFSAIGFLLIIGGFVLIKRDALRQAFTSRG